MDNFFEILISVNFDPYSFTYHKITNWYKELTHRWLISIWNILQVLFMLLVLLEGFMLLRPVSVLENTASHFNFNLISEIIFIYLVRLLLWLHTWIRDLFKILDMLKNALINLIITFFTKVCIKHFSQADQLSHMLLIARYQKPIVVLFIRLFEYNLWAKLLP